jgi:hypothetical protein
VEFKSRELRLFEANPIWVSNVGETTTRADHNLTTVWARSRIGIPGNESTDKQDTKKRKPVIRNCVNNL